MAVRWKGRSGDEEVFALKVEFADDPDGGRSIDPDVGISWGRFQIWIEGRILCAHQEADGWVDSVHWYLLPLIEWFTYNWNPLLHEERLPVQNRHDTAWESLRSTRFPPMAIENDEEKASAWESEWQRWWTRHALRSASEGGLFPDVVLRRLRDTAEVSWGPARSAGMPQHFRFSEAVQGVSRLAPRDVAEPLHDVLSNACGYLHSLAPESLRIKALLRSIRDLNAAGESDRRLMWLAGLGTDEETVSSGWARAKGILAKLGAASRSVLEIPDRSQLVISGSCQAALMFGSLAPNVGEQDILPLAQTMVDLSSTEGESDTIRAVSRSVPITGLQSPSWSEGYELAEDLHEDLDMEFVQGDSFDIERMIGKLGIRTIQLALSDEDIRAVSIAGPNHGPGIVVNTQDRRNAHSFGRRFTLAHELCHVLFDRQRGRRLAIASGPWAPQDVEKRANAFAAMLLMPPFLIQRAMASLTAPINTSVGVREVAQVLRVGVRSVLHHLKNLGFIADTDQERIENELLSISGW